MLGLKGGPIIDFLVIKKYESLGGRVGLCGGRNGEWRRDTLESEEEIINVECYNLFFVLPQVKSFFLFLKNLFSCGKCYSRILTNET